MRYIISDSTDAYFNLASEEYLLRKTTEEVTYLWRNDKAIIVGKNQNTVEEINVDYVKDHDIKVVRRLTGGGAVYHDLGNLNYTFIENDGKSFNDFKGFCLPIIEALKTLGVDAEFSGRNDMMIQGKKFSGTAQCKFQNRVMHHGTLLFSSIKNDLTRALKPKELKFQGKGVKSVVSRVTNISEHLVESMDVIEFRDYIMKYLSDNDEVTNFTPEEVEEIMVLRDEKYAQWSWNFGTSPKFSKTKEEKFKGGIVEVSLDVKKGLIKEIKIFGDFFSLLDVNDLEKALKETNYREEDVREKLNQLDFEKYMMNITKEEFMSLLL